MWHVNNWSRFTPICVHKMSQPYHAKWRNTKPIYIHAVILSPKYRYFIFPHSLFLFNYNFRIHLSEIRFICLIRLYTLEKNVYFVWQAQNCRLEKTNLIVLRYFCRVKNWVVYRSKTFQFLSAYDLVELGNFLFESSSIYSKFES